MVLGYYIVKPFNYLGKLLPGNIPPSSSAPPAHRRPSSSRNSQGQLLEQPRHYLGPRRLKRADEPLYDLFCKRRRWRAPTRHYLSRIISRHAYTIMRAAGGGGRWWPRGSRSARLNENYIVRGASLPLGSARGGACRWLWGVARLVRRGGGGVASGREPRDPGDPGETLDPTIYGDLTLCLFRLRDEISSV
jgi:hypothetical protein